MGRRCVLPPLTREQQARAASCYDRTRSVAYSYARNHGGLREVDDIESDAMYGLVSAARSFDPARNDNFAAFSIKRVLGAIRDGVRERIPLERSQQRKGFKPPEFKPLDVHMRDNDSEPVGFDLEQEDQLRWLMDPHLCARERHVIRRIYVDGAPGMVVSRELRVHPSRVSQLRKRALGLLHARFRAHAGE